jgi:hypothetical protein
MSSQTPRKYCCQPDLAIKQAQEAAREAARASCINLGDGDLKKIRDDIEKKVRPSFTDLIYPRPGYAQIRASCPLEIRTGADDGSEMGAFHDIYAPRREENLYLRLLEHLRLGLEAGIFYVN